MFGLFKRKKKEGEWQKIFEQEERRFHTNVLPIFQAVSEKLPEQYAHLKERFIPGLLRGCNPNAIRGGGNLYVFRIDQFSHQKYETEKNNYFIQNIKLYSNSLQRFETLKLHISNNIPIAFEFSTSDWNFDLSQIDTTQIRKFHWDNIPYQTWMKIIGKIPLEHSKRFDLINGFEIDLNCLKYFTLKDFGDGDYIAIKETREIYGLIHGKNLVEEIFKSPEELYEAIDKKTFDFEQYHSSKT
ncbi:MAG: hypothetical protein ABI675_05375 [Chitinophagaceae bacterium]